MSDASSGGEGNCDPVLFEDLWNQLALSPVEFREDVNFEEFLAGWEILSPLLAGRETTLREVIYRCCAASCQVRDDREWVEECDHILDNVAHLIEQCPIYVNSVHGAALEAKQLAAANALEIPTWLIRRFDERVLAVFSVVL